MNRLMHWTKKLRRKLSPPPLVLLYHRIAEPEIDPFGLAVSPKNFRTQLDVLRTHADVLPFAELIARCKRGELPARAVALTFDDGYVDNLGNAKSILEAAGIPALIYVATGFLGAQHEFWWDALETLLLYPGTFPTKLDLNVNEMRHTWSLENAAIYSESDFEKFRGWRASEPPPTRRHALFLEIYALLRPQPHALQQAALAQIREQLSAHRAPKDERRCVSESELHELAASNHIAIGVHTVTHRWLSAAGREEQMHELRESKSALEKLLARPIRDFSYPYGNYTAETPEIAAALCFQTAVTTEERALQNGEDFFQIPRVVCGDWDADAFAQKLSEWRAG